jgi:hypothetical protein
MPVRLVIAAGSAVLAGLVLFLLLGEDQRRAGGNFTPEWGPVIELRGADRHCQEGELVPADSAGLRLRVGTHGPPTPELSVRVTEPAGELVSSGRLAPGHPQGHVVIPIDRVDRTAAGLEVCVATGGAGRTVLYGRGDDVRFDWLRPGSESRVAMLPTVAHRFGLAKLNPFGDWLLVLVALVLVAACVVALRLVVREVGP